MSLMMDKSERLLKIQLHVRYQTVPAALDFRRRIVTSFTDKEITSAQQEKLDNVSDVIQVVSKKHKKRFRIEAHQTTIVLEDISKKEAENCLLDAVEKIRDELGITKVDSIRVRQIFALPAGKDFLSILNLFKKHVLNENNPLVLKASDVGVPLDFQLEDLFVHTMNGPMSRQQLQNDFLEFEQQDLPDNFIFVDIETRKNSIVILDRKTTVSFFRQHEEIVTRTITEWQKIIRNNII